MKSLGLGLALLMAASPGAAAEETLRAYAVQGDAIPQSLTGKPGDATRGAQLVADRQRGLCLLCHTGPFPDSQAQGTLAPDLEEQLAAANAARAAAFLARGGVVPTDRLSADFTPAVWAQ